MNPQVKVEPTVTTVTDRGLVTEKPKWKDIVANHQLYSTAHKDVKNFAGITLGYVTPVSGVAEATSNSVS